MKKMKSLLLLTLCLSLLVGTIPPISDGNVISPHGHHEAVGTKK